MIGSRPQEPGHRSGNAEDLHAVFVKRVHQLIKLGYDRLDRTACRDEEEPAITGDLVEAIESVLDDPASEEWVTFYQVCDDPPVNEAGQRGKNRGVKRKGKRRRRVDMRVVSSEQRPRTRFSFEAKRLSLTHPVDDYLGHDGLGRFLRGEYAREDRVAGMLGYVQSGDPCDWGNRISDVLTRRPKEHAVRADSPWQESPLVAGLDHTYRTGHRRRPAGRIDIYHTLLRFS